MHIQPGGQIQSTELILSPADPDLFLSVSNSRRRFCLCQTRHGGTECGLKSVETAERSNNVIRWRKERNLRFLDGFKNFPLQKVG